MNGKIGECGVDNILAHIHPTKQAETLSEHKERVLEYFNKIFDNSILDKLPIKDKNFLEKFIRDVVILHDEGKINPNFQYFKMKNPLFKTKAKKGKDTTHSMLGAKLFFKQFLDEVESVEDDEEYYKKLYLLYIGAFLIAKHHSKLNDFLEFKEEFDDILIEERIIEEEYRLEFLFDMKIYFFAKYLFSILISSDYYATTEYMNDLKFNDFGEIDILKAKKEFEEFYKFKPTKEIDFLRDELFKEATKNFLKYKNKNIFYLQAPTGAGKTLIGLNLALLANPRKIFYIFPFNTLVEQTKNVISKIFSFDIAVINSITPINIDSNSYEQIYINRVFYHYPFVITTHINFFNILFGVTKEDNFAFWQLRGSVIILDEIQSYDINLWWYMSEFFDLLEMFDIKIIIMSATLPKIDKLLGGNKFVELVESEKYFKNPIFKDRVRVDLSLLDEEVDFDRLVEIITSHKGKILIEFIKKSTANQFFEYIQDLEGYDIYLLSGDDNKLTRDFVINECKKEKNIILVATQVIEAGVDIDMDIGLKDISLIESEEQFIGRINRNSLKKSKVYFFDYDDSKEIYKDLRLLFNLKTYKEWFLEKNFDEYYKFILDEIEKKGNKIIYTKSDIEDFREKVKSLSFREIESKMKLIKNWTFTIFIPYKIDLNDKRYKNLKIDEKFVNNGYFDGMRVWEEFKEINKILEYPKKRIKLSYINYLMQFFTFSVMGYMNLSKYSDECCGVFMIEEYEEFMSEDLRFIRDRFNEYQEGIFL